jgi:predicted nucleic acid-binding OB-fold protein
MAMLEGTGRKHYKSPSEKRRDSKAQASFDDVLERLWGVNIQHRMVAGRIIL